MIETVVKRNGKEEAFSPEKLNGWGMFAAKTLPKGSVDWGSVVMQVVSGMGDKVTTKELQDALIKNCINRNTYEYSRMAGRLYASALPKEFYPTRKHPTLKELHAEMIKEGLIVKPNYSDEEYEELGKLIDHRKDYSYSYAAIRQLVNKMAVQNRITGKKFETPQFIFIRVVMQAYNNYKEADRMEHIRNMYNLISDRKINVPTPYYTNSLTQNPNTSSCCVMTSEDTAESIGVLNALGYMMTVASAGIGVHFKTRSLGDAVRGGLIHHLGKVPYYRGFAQTIKSSTQQGRSGAATCFYPFFDPEIIVLLSLKNPMSTPANRVREMDYSISLNNWMVIRAAKKQPVWLFSYKDNPELYELFYSGDVVKFGKEMEKFAKEYPDKVEEINAMELLSHAVKESMETGRIYLTFIDEMNRHTPFKHNIYSSNLCCFWEDETFGVYEGKDVKISRTVSFKELHNLIKSGKEFYIPSFNEKTKEMEIKRIANSALMRSGADVYTMKYTISYSSGVHRFSGNIRATEDHKFLLESGEWKEMKDLNKGDLIRSYDGQTVEFQSMEFFKVADVYDIEVEDNHNFFIRNVLASNCEISLSTKGYEKYEDLHYRVNPQKEFTRHDGSKGIMGEVAFCNLAGIVVSNIKSDEEYADAAYYALSLIESGIDNSSHAFPALEQAIRYRRSAGVGIMSLAHLMAKKNKKYSTQEGKDFIHEVFETHAWHLTKASLRLAKERGVCEGMEVSKYKDGWLPIDTYNKNVDELVTVENKRDWEGLRKEIIENGGIRHSTVCTEMPGESSSISMDCTNGVYGIRSLFLKKTSGDDSITWCAPDTYKLKDKYEIVWDIPSKDVIQCYAIMQKWTDQGISADLWVDRSKVLDVKLSQLIQEIIWMSKYGMKSRYYYNSKIEKEVKMDDVVNGEENQQEEPEQQTDEVGCSGGGCTL